LAETLLGKRRALNHFDFFFSANFDLCWLTRVTMKTFGTMLATNAPVKKSHKGGNALGARQIRDLEAQRNHRF